MTDVFHSIGETGLGRVIGQFVCGLATYAFVISALRQKNKPVPLAKWALELLVLALLCNSAYLFGSVLSAHAPSYPHKLIAGSCVIAWFVFFAVYKIMNVLYIPVRSITATGVAIWLTLSVMIFLSCLATLVGFDILVVSTSLGVPICNLRL
jgi:hypothetical protein